MVPTGCIFKATLSDNAVIVAIIKMFDRDKTFFHIIPL